MYVYVSERDRERYINLMWLEPSLLLEPSRFA